MYAYVFIMMMMNYLFYKMFISVILHVDWVIIKCENAKVRIKCENKVRKLLENNIKLITVTAMVIMGMGSPQLYCNSAALHSSTRSMALISQQ